jgi:hypothetical protein
LLWVTARNTNMLMNTGTRCWEIAFEYSMRISLSELVSSKRLCFWEGSITKRNMILKVAQYFHLKCLNATWLANSKGVAKTHGDNPTYMTSAHSMLGNLRVVSLLLDKHLLLPDQQQA